MARAASSSRVPFACPVSSRNRHIVQWALRAQRLHPRPLELGVEEALVELDVVPDQHALSDEIAQHLRLFGEGRPAGHVRIAQPVHRGGGLRDGNAGVNLDH